MSAPSSVLLPREHGAWGLLFQPFLAGAILAGRWSWLLFPAAVLLFLGFVLRAPLTVLARQALVWHARNPDTPRALRWLLLELGGLALCALALSTSVPADLLAGFLAAGFMLTMLAVWVTVRNRQRSIPFQLASAAVLSVSAPLVVYLVTGALPYWAWLLWAVLFSHAAFSILVVHARLAARTAARQAGVGSSLQRDVLYQLIQTPVVLAFITFHWPLVLPAGYSVAANLLEVRRIHTGLGLSEPLTRVGIRTLGSSLAHTALAIVALWSLARGECCSPRG
jgi:hypothetical protein